MQKFVTAALAASVLSPAAMAQAPQAPAANAPVVASIAPPAPVAQASLPANTEVLVRMNEDLSTKGGKIEVGHMFRLSVSDDVRIGNAIVIPRGTPAFGEVTWKTGKGAFGKSGKMEIEIRYIDLNGRRVPTSGKYRQEGEGNTVATVAALATLWVAAPFITGKSAVIPQGRELKAYTTEALPVVLPAVAPAPAPVAVPVQASAPAAPVAALKN